MVPPIWVREISGMKMITSSFSSESNSVEPAPGRMGANQYSLEAGGKWKGKIFTWDVQHMARPFNNSKLKAQADTQEWDLLFPRPLDREDHAVSSSLTETAWYENASAVRKRGELS